MKAVAVKEFHQNLSQVHISAVPQPVPQPDEILIKVIAAGVNFVDTLYV
jgi:NADPH:quinone reductase